MSLPQVSNLKPLIHSQRTLPLNDTSEGTQIHRRYAKALKQEKSKEKIILYYTHFSGLFHLEISSSNDLKLNHNFKALAE